MSDKPKKLKRCVIKEELVLLCGDYIQAVILNQFIYWSERTKDTDAFILEERNRDPSLDLELTQGWIYKTATELNEETMLGMSDSTIRRHLAKVIKAGFIDQRNNPNYKWDRTLQYRPNIVKIQQELHSLGYNLEGYPLVVDAFFKMKNGVSKMKNRTIQNEGALPETTTENTTDFNGSAKNSPNQKEELNAYADQVAAVCSVDIDTASPQTRDAIKRVTLALHKKVKVEDLRGFLDFWYNSTWQGQKGQSPTPSQLGDMWGQFEAQNKKKPTTIIDSGGGLYV
ncbi:MAG: hypothetical protein GY743_23505 [Planctomycetaceae bacterium]|nr:hypothetical protein [Planctomycetaceae bacterium]